MNNNNFILLSNQRCGSTWLITSLGNCKTIETDYEIKWSNDLLLSKASPYHLFLNNNNLDDIFKKFPNFDIDKTYGSKFVYDFYKNLPFNNYNEFLNKFIGYKILHITRDYLDILKSKLVGKVIHLLDYKYIEHNRIIDKTIYDKQKEYEKMHELSKTNKKMISFKEANSYLLNLFINDIISLSLKNKNKYLNIEYEEIKKNINKLSSFLQVPQKELDEKLFEKPTIKKNNINYKNNFENFEKLQILNFKLKNKINYLRENNFKLEDILSYDIISKKLKIKI
tara:strand:- start:1025 stop:1870 length:846 start_codon:yes stop_codon:yes gene_type:complete